MSGEAGVNEKPILFSAPMVRAILNVRPGVWPAEPIDPDKPWKWQTRRVIKPQPILVDGKTWTWPCDGRESKASWGVDVHPVECMSRFCPYGPPGTRLWVRETWAYSSDWDHYNQLSPKEPYLYRSTYPDAPVSKWRPSIFMPRWASRILLEVKAVRVERVQDISEEDAQAEGAERMHIDDLGQSFKTYRRGFESLWDSINAKLGCGWDKNPWVWVIEFGRLA